MLDVNLVSAGHARRYSIVLAGADGWEVRFEEDQSLRWRQIWTDWHRVERARARVEQEVTALLQSGWRIEPVSR